MRRVSFDAQAWADYNWWGRQDPKVQKRIFELIEASTRDPFSGLGKPNRCDTNFEDVGPDE